jgi:mannose-1-phosphate guanylyltransferase
VIRRAMVLAAGFGTRLAPLTNTLPKPLVPVAGVPFLDHLLGWLRDGGIREVVINLHHLGQLIEAHVGDGARFGLAVRYSRETTILDTGGGIKHAQALLDGEPFFVANGDSLLEISLGELADFHRARRGIATLAVRPDPEAARLGLVEIDDDARIRRIAGRPDGVAARPLRGFMFPGLHVLEPSIFQHMPVGGAFGIARTTYPELIARGLPLFGYETSARWINIDTPASVQAADQEIRRSPIAQPR